MESATLTRLNELVYEGEIVANNEVDRRIDLGRGLGYLNVPSTANYVLVQRIMSEVKYDKLYVYYQKRPEWTNQDKELPWDMHKPARAFGSDSFPNDLREVVIRALIDLKSLK